MKFLFYALFALLTAGSFSAYAQPSLTSSHTPPAICDSTMFNYTPTSDSPGVSFYWSRSFTPGIPLLSATGTGDIHEVLDNSTYVALSVVYTYTLVLGTDTSVQTVIVSVLPTPRLSSPLADTVCSGSLFSYFAASTTTMGVVYEWSRAAAAGISTPASAGVGAVNEVLVNTTAGPLTAIYTYTLSVSECHYAYPVQVAVYPLPAVGSITGDTLVCVNNSISLNNTVAGGTWTSSNAHASVSAIGLVTGLTAGIDTIIYTTANASCSAADSVRLKVDTCFAAGVAPLDLAADINIYPNPCRGSFVLTGTGAGRLSLYNIDGRLLTSYAITDRSVPIQLPANLGEGMYTGVFVGADGGRLVQKIIYKP